MSAPPIRPSSKDDVAPESSPWWEESRTPGVGGAGAAQQIERARRDHERRIRNAAQAQEAAELAGLSRRERRRARRARRADERHIRQAVARHRAAVAAADARESRGDERRLVDQVVDALGDWVPLACEQTPHEATTANSAAIYPFYNDAGIGTRGPLIGLNVTGGGSFSFDPWHLYSGSSFTPDETGPRLITNGNILVLGTPGSGKSALVKTFAYRQAAFGRRCEFVDPKGEYGDIVAALGGEVIALRPGGEQALNPLTDVGDPLVRQNLLLSLGRALLGRSLRPPEKVGLLSALEQADSAAAAEGSDREVCLPDVEAALREPGPAIQDAMNADEGFCREQLRDVMLELRLLREGPLAGMFDRATNIPEDTWERRAISIDLSAVARLAGADDAGQNLPLAITMMCASAFLTAKALERAERARRTGKTVPKTVRINDEGWRVLSIPGQAQQYQSDFKLQRASGVVNVVVMHRFSDLRAAGDEGSRAAKIAEGLLSDADTVVVYQQAEAELSDVQAKLHLTESETTVVEHLETGQALWLVGQWRGLIHHLRSATEVRLSDTDEAMRADTPHRDRGAVDALAAA